MAVTINIPSQVKTYANLAAFPALGSLKTIYIAEDTNKTYRWTGTAYVEISGADFSGYVPTSRTLTINGTTQDLSANRTFTIPTDLTVGTTPIASGTIGRVLFEGTGNVLQQSSNLTFDNVTGLLTVTGGLTVNGGTTIPHIRGNALRISNTANGAIGSLRLGSVNNIEGDLGMFTFLNDTTRLVRFFSNGNVGINQFTDAGFRLDVNGTARVSGQISSGITGTNGNVGIRRTADGGIVGSFYTDGTQTIVKEHTGTGGVLLNGFDTTSLKWMGNSSQPRVGIGFNGTISATCHIKGAFATSATSSLLIENSASTELFRVRDNGNVGINTTTDAGFRLDVNGTARVRGTGTTIGTTSFTVQDSASSDLFRVYDNGLVAIKAGVISLNGSNGSITGGFIASTGQIISGGTSITASAQMEVISTTRGFLPPRMTTTQRNAIASPAAGLVVYDNTDNKHYGYNGTTWNAFY